MKKMADKAAYKLYLLHYGASYPIIAKKFFKVQLREVCEEA